MPLTNTLQIISDHKKLYASGWDISAVDQAIVFCAAFHGTRRPSEKLAFAQRASAPHQ
jgi:hypothetical protein